MRLLVITVLCALSAVVLCALASAIARKELTPAQSVKRFCLQEPLYGACIEAVDECEIQSWGMNLSMCDGDDDPVECGKDWEEMEILHCMREKHYDANYFEFERRLALLPTA